MLYLIALRNVKVHWRQSLAALLSISAAFFAFVIFQGYMLDVERLYFDGNRNRAMYGDLIIENKMATSSEAQKDTWKYTLTNADQKMIQQLIEKHQPEIQGEVRFLDFHGLIATGMSSKIFIAEATDIDKGAAVRSQWAWNALYGEPLHLAKGANSVLLALGLAQQLGCKPTQEIYSLRPEGGFASEVRPFDCRRSDLQMAVTTESGNLNAMDFEVVGLMDSGYRDIDTRYLMISLPAAQQLLNTDRISFWTVKLKDNVSAKNWIENFNKELSGLNPELHAQSWQEHKVGDLYRKTMSILNIFRNFVTLVVAFISILSVTNTMVKIVKERTREVGTLLSLGFQREQVMGIFLLESVFLSMLGCLVGAIASIIMTFILNHAGITYNGGILSQPVYFLILPSPMLYLTALALLLAVTVLASFLACRSTVQKKIVECLGHV